MTNVRIRVLGDCPSFSGAAVKRLFEGSSIVSIIEIDVVPRTQIPDGVLNDLAQLLPFANAQDHELVILVINRGLPGAWFTRRVNDRAAVISLFDMGLLSHYEGIRIEMYVARFVYGLSAIHDSHGHTLPEEHLVNGLMQLESQGCLFDFCKIREDVVKFFRKPHVSVHALQYLGGRVLPDGYTAALQREVLRLKVGLPYQLKAWLSNHPLIAMVLPFVLGVTTGVLGNWVFRWMTQ